MQMGCPLPLPGCVGRDRGEAGQRYHFDREQADPVLAQLFTAAQPSGPAPFGRACHPRCVGIGILHAVGPFDISVGVSQQGREHTQTRIVIGSHLRRHRSGSPCSSRLRRCLHLARARGRRPVSGKSGGRGGWPLSETDGQGDIGGELQPHERQGVDRVWSEGRMTCRRPAFLREQEQAQTSRCKQRLQQLIIHFAMRMLQHHRRSVGIAYRPFEQR